MKKKNKKISTFCWFLCDACGGYGVEEKIENSEMTGYIDGGSECYWMEIISDITPDFGLCSECFKDMMMGRVRGSWRESLGAQDIILISHPCEVGDFITNAVTTTDANGEYTFTKSGSKD